MYRDGVPLEDMQRRLCEQIDQRMERISQYKEEIAGVRSKKVCPSCGASVDMGMAFCPYCGAAGTVREPEEQAGEVIAEGTAEVKEETVEEAVPAAEEPTEKAAPGETQETPDETEADREPL